MKLFLLREIAMTCQDCGMSAMVIFRAETEGQAREMASRSNTHGTFISKVDWKDPKQVECAELTADGPQGIVAGVWLPQQFAG